MAPTLPTSCGSLPPEGALASLGRPGAGSVASTLGSGVGSPHRRFWPEGMPRTIVVPERCLFDNLRAAAEARPEHAALVFEAETCSYGDLLARVLALAVVLHQHLGVRHGDRVALFSQNCPAFVIAYYAVLRLGAVVVPVSAMATADDLAWHVQDSGARVVLVGAELADRAEAVRAQAPLSHVLVHQGWGGAAWDALLALPAARNADNASANGGGAELPDALAAPDDLCVLPYTSGTTGKPKGCRHTHRSMMTALAGSRAWRGLGPDMVALAVAPMFHLLGQQNGMNLPILCGGTVIMLPRWDRVAAAQLIAQHRVTFWAAPPTMVVDFFAQPGIEAFDLSSLRLLVGGGAAVPDAVSAQLRARYGLVLNEAYGMTETASFLHCNPLGREKPTCLGVPTFGVDSRVIDPATLAELPPGETGELVTHGGQVMLGYWGRPDADAEAFITLDGKRFLRTGDLCAVDEEGYFFMRDRLKRMISVSGYKVWPAEVENLLYRHPDVQEACVIGVPDARAGEAVKALLVLRPEARGTLTADAFIAWAREHMAVIKVPRYVAFVEHLPKSGTGKILWRELQDAERSAASATPT